MADRSGRAGRPERKDSAPLKALKRLLVRLRRSTPVRRIGRLLLVLAIAPTLVIAAYRFVDPPITPLMLIRVVEGEGLNKQWLTLPQISPHLVDAVLASEDNRFCEHFGFDWQALHQQVEAWQAGRRPSGASTITMQVAKNILLWPGRDPVRKVLEAWLTPQIELLWSKRRIIEIYLNVVEMGSGVYGAEAAARAYFGKGAGTLGRREAARIAAILPNPRTWSANGPSVFINRRVDTILRRVGQLGSALDCVR